MAGRTDIRMLQALRAAACLMVVVYHTLQAACGDAAISAWPNGSAGVDLFFVISGFVMVTSSRGLVGGPAPARIFLARRARRIVPLYWLLTLTKLCVTRAAPSLTPHTLLTLWNVCASLLFIPARDAGGVVRPVLPVGWSLNFEVFFYALFATALALRRRVFWVVPVLAAAALAGFWRTAGWPAPLFLANGMVLEFAAGMALAHFPFRPRPRTAACIMALAFAALLGLPLAAPWRFLMWGGPAAAILAAALMLEACAGGRLPRWLLAVGDASYAIYLVHPFIVPALAPHGAPAAVLVSVAAGVAVHRWVDAPMQQRSKQAFSFLKKRNKKLLPLERGGAANSEPKSQKFFGSFFQKRTFLLHSD